MNLNVNALKLHEEDNVAVALKNLEKDDLLKVHGATEEIKVLRTIPYGHKVSLEKINKEEKITKYGESMGIATEYINKGDHVHEFNIKGLHDIDKDSLVKDGTKVENIQRI